MTRRVFLALAATPSNHADIKLPTRPNPEDVAWRPEIRQSGPNAFDLMPSRNHQTESLLGRRGRGRWRTAPDVGPDRPGKPNSWNVRSKTVKAYSAFVVKSASQVTR